MLSLLKSRNDEMKEWTDTHEHKKENECAIVSASSSSSSSASFSSSSPLSSSIHDTFLSQIEHANEHEGLSGGGVHAEKSLVARLQQQMDDTAALAQAMLATPNTRRRTLLATHEQSLMHHRTPSTNEPSNFACKSLPSLSLTLTQARFQHQQLCPFVSCYPVDGEQANEQDEWITSADLAANLMMVIVNDTLDLRKMESSTRETPHTLTHSLNQSINQSITHGLYLHTRAALHTF